MPNLSVSSIDDALIIFADIIDSSKYSSILGYKDYAVRLLNFHLLFENLGKLYFPNPDNRALKFTRVKAQGDEGIVFCLDNSVEPEELIYKGIEFLFELKSNLHLIGVEANQHDEQNQDNTSPTKLSLGAGIHFGHVATISTIEGADSNISDIEGFAINYAKRVESCSRSGNFSRVFLSKEAAKYIQIKPVIFNKVIAPMKGIDEHAEVYEVQAGLFYDIPKQDDQTLINAVRHLADNPREINENWLKSLIVSYLDSLFRSGLTATIRETYNQQMLNLAWYNHCEDDPILLFIRARDYESRQEYTQQIRYLKEIADHYPSFFQARAKMVECYWNISRGNVERAEKIYARDIAKEFMIKFESYLSDSEKDKFRLIINDQN